MFNSNALITSVCVGGGLSVPATVIYLTNKNINFPSKQNLANFVFFNFNNSLNKDNYLSDIASLQTQDTDGSINLSINTTNDVNVNSLNVSNSNTLNSGFSTNDLNLKIKNLNNQNKSLEDAKKKAAELEKAKKKTKPDNDITTSINSKFTPVIEGAAVGLEI